MADGRFLFLFIVCIPFSVLFSPCSRGEDHCGNRLTSCRACYYCGTKRKAPKECRRFVKMKPTQSLAGAHSIVKRWGKCVEEAYQKVFFYENFEVESNVLPHTSTRTQPCMHPLTHARMHAPTHARMHAPTHARMHAPTRTCTYTTMQKHAG